MKKIVLFITLFYGVFPSLYSQNSKAADGVVAFSLPVRNSLKYNQFVINPAFSFVRQSATYVSFYNKREWIQFDNAPQTYLFSYSGRFLENEGIGIGVFQQNYGVLTTFGVIGNFAHNLVLQQESNLTFGLNLAAYKSGINQGKVILNTPEPSLDNVPSNTILSVSPGINYGNAFWDIGLAISNLVLYDFTTSEMLQDDPEQALQVHTMYTGYIDTYGFFDKSKFSTLIRGDFSKEKTVASGVAMLMIPQGAWAQAGYNTLYGFSAGLGANISPKIAIEYNFEKGTGNFSNFGSSHEFTIAYKFISKKYYYGDEEEEGALIKSNPVRKPVASSSKTPTTKVTPEQKAAEAKLVSDAKSKADAEKLQAKLALDLKTKADAEALNAKLAADAKAKADAQAVNAKLAADAKVKANADLQKAKLAADAKAVADAKAKADGDALRLKLAAEAKAKADAQAQQAKLDADAKALADAKSKQEKIAADAQLKADAAALQAKLAAEAKAKADAQALTEKIAADNKAKVDADALLAKIAQQNKAKLAADNKAKADALQAKLAADAKAKADAEAASLLAAANAKAEIEAQQAKLAADAKAKADADSAAQQAKLAKEAQEKAAAEAAALIAAANAIKEVPKDEVAKSIVNLAESVDSNLKTQTDLIGQLNSTVASKQKELEQMREENDLSEKGIYKEPKELVFKSVSEENAKIETLKNQIKEVGKNQNLALQDLNKLYNDRLKTVPNKNDALNKSYLEKIEVLKAEQLQVEKSNTVLLANLEKIKVETEIERKRRIKRAAFENDQGKYQQDQVTLKRIKETTKLSATPLTAADFNFGEEQSNMQIIKNIKNQKSGYYLILAVHNNVEQRDEFLKNAVAAGRSDINFFYNLNTSKYYIYYERFDSIEEAQKALDKKGSQPYTEKMSVVKLENE